MLNKWTISRSIIRWDFPRTLHTNGSINCHSDSAYYWKHVKLTAASDLGLGGGFRWVVHFLHQLQLASLDFATIWQKESQKMKFRIPQTNSSFWIFFLIFLHVSQFILERLEVIQGVTWGTGSAGHDLTVSTLPIPT